MKHNYYEGKPFLHVFECINCGVITASSRKGKLTCSTKCRVAAHRSGIIKKKAEFMKTQPLIKDVPLSVAVNSSGIVELDKLLGTSFKEELLRDGLTKKIEYEIYKAFCDYLDNHQ